MPRFKQFRDPELSIWQSAVEEVQAPRAAEAEEVGAAPVTAGRPDELDPISSEAVTYCNQVSTGATLAKATGVHPATEGLAQTAGFCSLVALKLAKAKLTGNKEDEQRIRMSSPSSGTAIPDTLKPPPSTPSISWPSRIRSLTTCTGT
jgi:hypothetical protein